MRNEFAAYNLDAAVLEFGAWVESELDKVKGKNTQATTKRREAKLLAILTGNKAKAYADPAAKFAAKR